MFFIMAFQEISTAIFLYRGGWETLPIGIYLNWHRGMEFGIAAAMAFLMIVITFILLLIISRIGGGVLKAAWGVGGSNESCSCVRANEPSEPSLRRQMNGIYRDPKPVQAL